MVYGRSIAIGVLFLAIICALSALIFYLSLGPCPHGTFACDNGELCVLQRQICNNHRDCHDGSDEDPVECGLLYGSREMTNKIVGNAIEKQRRQQQLTTTATNSTSVDSNTVTRLGRIQQGEQEFNLNKHLQQNITKSTTAITMPASTTTPATTSINVNNTSRIICVSLIEISTYPKQCTCLKSLIFCKNTAKLTKIPEIGQQVTDIIIIDNNLTLQANDLQYFTKLRRLKLKANNIKELPLGLFQHLDQLKTLDLRYNQLTILQPFTFKGLINLQWLFLGSNRLTCLPVKEMFLNLPRLEWLHLSDNLLSLNGSNFPRMQVLYELYLDYNRILYIGEETFAQLDNLHLLSLNGNLITHIHPRAFWGLQNIRDIRLINNPLKHLSGETFFNNYHLDALSLGHTPLRIENSFMQWLNISYLNLTGIRFEMIEFDTIKVMHNLKYIIYDRFYFCSMTPNVRMCKPNSDGVSSFKDLLSKPVLRYSAWIMAFITITGNIMVLWGRFIYRDENKAVTMVIRNLALADILMGFYLLTIGLQDIRYRNIYHRVALDWITSWHCAAIGVLAVSSSEVSMLILAFMSLERFLLIADPFRGHHRISARNIFIALLTIWLMGVGIAVAPVILWHSSTKFYGTYSGTCFPLHIQEPYPLGWQYSAFMFLGVNLFLLVMIALLYTALLISIWRTRKATPLSLLDCEFAVRFFFIVLTDVLCWAPIIVVKIWVFFNYNISDDIYAWLVVFILPLNSAVNPLLYTFTTPKYRNQILSRGWKKITSRRRHEPSNGLATTIATATDEYSGKAIPLVVTK
ncbi:relaxin receptor 2 [Calliphora vicina]|uniref:relaxin receptor 2 n=1 Tax=Calliphora vicina TaxID=7373 RepID=UPI00325AB66E